MTSPELLIARAASDSVVVEFLSGLNESPAKDHFADFEVRDYVESGVSIYISDDHHRVTTLFLYDGSEPDHRRYKGVLPYGLHFSQDIAAVERTLGAARKKGIEEPSRLRWCRFDYPTVILHVQFGKSGTIRMITLMDPRSVGQEN
jgi:hypothetical protein